MGVIEAYNEGKYTQVVNLVKANSEPQYIELKAFSLQKLGRFEDAMEIWNFLIITDQNNASYYNERGVCKYNLKFKHAIDDFNKAVSLEPDSAYFHSCRAFIKDKTGDTEGAVEDYARAHDLDPEDAITLNNLGLAEQKLGHTQNARNFFKKSDDLLGISTIDSRSEPDSTVPAITIGAKIKEMRKMLSSRKEFMSFLKEAFTFQKK